MGEAKVYSFIVEIVDGKRILLEDCSLKWIDDLIVEFGAVITKIVQIR